MTNYTLIYSTFPSTTEARKAGKSLINKRLAACVNIIPKMESIYMWEDKIQSSSEVVMLVKTTKSKSKAVIKLLTDGHSYDCPCVIELPINGGNPDFLKWIKDICK